MSNNDDVEAPSPVVVIRDGIVSALVVITAAAIDWVSHLMFPDGVPVLVRACLLVSDLALLVAFLITFVRLLRSLIAGLEEVFSFRTAVQQIRSSGIFTPIWRAYRTAVGAGSITGASIGVIALLLIILSSAPLWVRAALFLLGGLLVVASIVVLYAEMSMLSAQQAGQSGGCFIGFFLIVLIPGLLILSLTFTAQIEVWTAGLHSLARTLLE